MKKYKLVTLLFVVVFGSVGSAVIQYNIKYGEAATLDFPIWDSNSPWALYETAPATADCNLFRDQGSSESLDNAVVDEGSFMSWTISATEAQCKTATMVIKDASAPPLFMDEVILITTHGNASAFNIFDLDKDFQDLLRFGLKAATGLSDPNDDSLIDMVQDVNGITESTGIIARDPNDDYFATHTEFNTFIGSAMTSTDVQNDMRFILKSATGISDANDDSPVDILQDVNGIMSTLGILARDPNDEYFAVHGETSASFQSDIRYMLKNATGLTDPNSGSVIDMLQDTILAVLLNPPTTIATLASQTSWTLTAGSADDDAYNDRFVIIQDASTVTQVAVGTVKDYTGSTKTVTLYKDPGVFTMATTDKVIILPIKHVRGSIDRGGGTIK